MTGKKHGVRFHERNPVTTAAPAPPCWLCGRPMGQGAEMHHPLPKSRGGRETVVVHPICHRTIHVAWSNADLARIGDARDVVAAHPDVARFLVWIANKSPDFHARTAKRRKI